MALNIVSLSSTLLLCKHSQHARCWLLAIIALASPFHALRTTPSALPWSNAGFTTRPPQRRCQMLLRAAQRLHRLKRDVQMTRLQCASHCGAAAKCPPLYTHFGALQARHLRCAVPERQAVCALSRYSAQLAQHHSRSSEWQFRQRRRRAFKLACAASYSSAHSPDSGNGKSTPSSSNSSRRAPSGVLKFLQDQYLPIALLVGMTVGYLAPGPGIAAADAGLQGLTTTGIFVLSGLALKRGEAMRALSAWGALAFGFASILFITPLAALAVQRLPLGSPEFSMGLAVFCCMPTTLSSGVSLTQAVGGNAALALLLTVGTNLAGIFTMPFLLCALLDTGTSSVALSPGPLLQSLVKTILVPLLIGAGARALIPGVAGFVDRKKKVLALASASLLALVPWMQISKAVSSDITVSLGALAAVVAAGVAVHIGFLAFNTAAVRLLRIGGRDRLASHISFLAFDTAAVRLLHIGGRDRLAPEGERRALILVGSQKTLPIAVTVLGQLSTVLPGAMGLAVIPCVVSHLSQILMDSFLVSWWLKQDATRARTQVKTA